MIVSLREIKEPSWLYFEILHADTSSFFARSCEEFSAYIAKDGCRIYRALDGRINAGFIFVIVHGNRSIVTGIMIENPKYTLHWEYCLKNEDVSLLGDCSCVNFPSNINFPDLHIGQLFWEIQEYSVKYDEICLFNENRNQFHYFVDSLSEAENIKEILEFDYNLFSLTDREYFIDTCCKNSDAVYVVKIGCTIKGYGMLSRPVNNKRLLGPVYAVDDFAAFDIIDAIFYAVVNEFYAETLIAYVPVRKTYPILLESRGFLLNRYKVWLRYTSCQNYNVNNRNIITLGSLAFDVC